MSKLIEKRANLVAEMRNLLDGSEGLSADDQTKLAQIEDAFDRCDKAIRAEEKLNKIEGKLNAIIEDSYRPSIEKENNVDSYGDAFYAYARQGLSSLTGDRLAALQVGTDSEGGYVVPESFETKLVTLLQSANPFRGLANVIKTASDRNIPVESSVGTFAYVAEEAAYGNVDPAFGRVIIGSHKSGGIVKVSEELLQDSFFNLETYLANVAGRRFATLEEASFCNGTGSAQPQGIFNPTYANNVTGAVSASAAITADDLINTFHSLTRPYRANAAWVLGDDAVKIIRKLVDGNGQYVWQPGLVAGAPDTIFGRPVIVSSAVTAAAPTVKSIVFGDLGYYTIADRAGISAQKLIELYAANGQVGYKFTARNDAKVVLATAFTSFTHGAAS